MHCSACMHLRDAHRRACGTGSTGRGNGGTSGRPPQGPAGRGDEQLLRVQVWILVMFRYGLDWARLWSFSVSSSSLVGRCCILHFATRLCMLRTRCTNTVRAHTALGSSIKAHKTHTTPKSTDTAPANTNIPQEHSLSPHAAEHKHSPYEHGQPRAAPSQPRRAHTTHASTHSPEEHSV